MADTARDGRTDSGESTTSKQIAEPGVYLANATGALTPILTESGDVDRDLLADALDAQDLTVVDTDADDAEIPPLTMVCDGVGPGGRALVKLGVEDGEKHVERTFEPDDAKALGRALIAVGEHAEDAAEECEEVSA